MHLNTLILSLLLSLLTATAQAQPLFLRHSTAPIDVNGRVFRGGRPYEPRLIELAQHGFRTVINLQGGDLRNFGLGPIVRAWEPGEIRHNIALERQMVEGLGMRFVNVPINSLMGVRPMDEANLNEALRLMNSPEAQPVFVHCEFGRDRTGLVVALYRVKYENWNVLDAYQEWVGNGHRALARMITGSLDRYYFRKVREFTNSCDEVLK